MRWKDIAGDYFRENVDMQIKAADVAVKRAQAQKKQAEIIKLKDKLTLKQRQLVQAKMAGGK
ncbi:hypothetical protein [Azospirillum brasilense]|uniref:hypothetical protein n=1 Tax=Azospirillum brasilense TaxID=192 RepID=UPI000FEF80DE|nr:hypothetical protein [Azospirillum brasilense]NUB24336.1 hypothetical protein [Azospirillum brasilense]NUB30837.1 hypothetical protein [Azospirillum brasilense]RIW01014.1 hypothetical protein D2T81_19605 [Azospirillum brasilense]